VQNGDRTLSEHGGNPNLLWGGYFSNDLIRKDNCLYVIDHNLIFDPSFNAKRFLDTHAFAANMASVQSDFIMHTEYEQKMQAALQVWGAAWEAVPCEWKEENEETGLFNQDAIFAQLMSDAQGAIWTRLMQ